MNQSLYALITDLVEMLVKNKVSTSRIIILLKQYGFTDKDIESQFYFLGK